MVIHICERCLCEFKKKSAHDSHINKKFKCVLHSSLVKQNNDQILIFEDMLNEFKKVKEEHNLFREENQ